MSMSEEYKVLSRCGIPHGLGLVSANYNGPTERKDDRTPEQKETHNWLVIGTDSFLSGWGGAKGGLSYAAWACRPEDVDAVESWVSGRSDMYRVRVTTDPYSPPSECAHLHIYVVEEDHPSIR